MAAHLLRRAGPVLSRLDIGLRGIAAALLVVAVVLASANAEADEASGVQDELLVRSKVGARDSADAALASEGAATQRELSALGVSVVRLPRGRRAAAQKRLRASGHFRFVERNAVAAATETPDDPLYPGQWGLAAVQAPLAWDSTFGLGITLALVDSGVDVLHGDLAPQLVAGFNAIDDSSNVVDDNGHGTHMAGIAAARGFNGFGVIGLAPEAQLMPIKALNSTGQGSYADVAQGVIYAVNHGARVISLSLGGEMGSATLASAVSYAVSHGAVVVAAAGNSGSSAQTYPAAYSDAIAVGASDINDERASFSNYGQWLDLVAPGVGISTTAIGGGFAQSSGTSPATPMVAAAAALVLSANPALQPAQVASILSMTSDELGEPGFDVYYGWGRLNAAQAVAQALALAQQADSSMPTAQMVAPEDGSMADGELSMAALVSDDVGVTRVEYILDGVVVAVSTQAPFEAEWNSAEALPGPHLLRAAAFDASGNRGLSAPVSVTVAGNQADCDTGGWTCLPGAGPTRSDCFAEWLVRADTAASDVREKAKIVCTDGSACDVDGVVDGGCTFAVGLCFAVDDDRLLDRHGLQACEVDDLSDFQVITPGFRRAVDPVDKANAQAVLAAVAALSTGDMQGRCATGAKGRVCGDDGGCDSAPGVHDGLCGLERTALTGVGGVASCTVPQSIRVPLRQKGTKLRKGVRVFKAATTAWVDTGRRPRDGDGLRLECLPAE